MMTKVTMPADPRSMGTVPAVVFGGLATLLVAAIWSKQFPALRRADRPDPLPDREDSFGTLREPQPTLGRRQTRQQKLIDCNDHDQ